MKSAFSCLLDIPINAVIETSFMNSSFAGQLFNADDQCKLIIGTNSNAAQCTVIYFTCFYFLDYKRHISVPKTKQ